MPAVKQPINPEVLSWALRDSGVSRNQLVHELNISTEVLDSWLNGEDMPGITQLRKLAKALRRPTSFFFLPKAPNRPPADAAFRHPIGHNGPRFLTADETAEIRRAQRKQKIAAWALNAAEVDTRMELPRRDESPETTARRTQDWLSWSVELQVDATSKSAVTKLVRKRLEDHGILVLQIGMGEDACRGFSISDPQVPLIGFNSTKQVASARTFTLLHELGHLLAGERAVCGSPDDQEERWCDRFAASFLLPERHLRQYLKMRRTNYVDGQDIESVRLVSNRYKASYQCVALRLIELKLADWRLYDIVRQGNQEVDQGFSREPQTTPVVRLREYGTAYPRVILAAREAGALADLDVRRYLNVNGDQLATLRSRLLEGA